MSLLRTDHDAAMRFVLRQGIIPSHSAKDRETARYLLCSVFTVIRRELLSSTLSYVYTYDQDKQPGGIAQFDGYASVSERMPNGWHASAIGISCQALHAGKDHAAFIVLHEFAHICKAFPSEHGPLYHAYLDGLIRRYNQATGSTIVNDYQGL